MLLERFSVVFGFLKYDPKEEVIEYKATVQVDLDSVCDPSYHIW